MSLFSRKETIVLKTERQKDAYIERLENAHIAYDVFETTDILYGGGTSYIVRVKAADLKKIS